MQQLVTVVMCSWSGRPARPRTQHDYHHDTKVKPEAATAVIELLMMGGKTPETCWAVNKRQENKLKIVTSGWWFILIVRWCTNLQTLNKNTNMSSFVAVNIMCIVIRKHTHSEVIQTFIQYAELKNYCDWRSVVDLQAIITEILKL